MSAPSRTPRRQDSYFAGADSPISPGATSPSIRSSRFSFGGPDVSRYRARRGSTSSIASSIGGVLDTAPANHNSLANDLTQNSIASLLSTPIVRTGLTQSAAATARTPTTRDIPPVALTPIPHVDNTVFSSYLANVGALYDTFQRAKAAANEGAALLFQNRQDGLERPPFERRNTSDYGPASPTGSVRTLSPPATPQPRRKSSGRPRRDPNAPTPLSTIPAVYFEENFELENPRIFDVVSERSDVLPKQAPGSASANGSAKAVATTGRKALHTNAILQEKLSWYMDTVEVHLISSIASASSSFFAALGSLKELHSEATSSIESIKTLRASLKTLDEEMVNEGLEIVKLKQRRQNIAKLESAVEQLCEAVDKAQECERLLEAGELDKVNDSIDELEGLVSGRARPEDTSQRIDLRRLKALEGMNEGIAQLRLQVGRGFEGKFIDALLEDLRQHIESVPPKETLQRWAYSSMRNRTDPSRAKPGSPAYLKTNEGLRPALLAALAGLSSSGVASRAASAYREAVMRELKTLIRKRLPSSTDDDVDSTTSSSTRNTGRKLTQQEKSAILARNLRALDGTEAEELLVAVYTSVSEALRRLGQQVKVLLDVTISMEPNTITGARRGSSAIREEVAQALDLQALLGQAVDVVHNQIIKVLKVRGEQTTHLPSAQLLRFYTLNRLFADECEHVSSRPGEALKEVVNNQVRDFLQVFADNERQAIANTLDSDRWEAKEFTSADNAVLTRILSSMTKTPRQWTEYTKLWESEDTPTTTNHINGSSTTTQNSTTPSTATIDDQKFILVASAIAALHGLDRFLTLTTGIPAFTSDTTTRLLDYLKLFNSRCQQLVLGAGATRSAGLKNITTKNLALASQACSFLIALLPYIREYVRRSAPGSASAAVLPEFEKVKRVIYDHQGSIRDKLVEIMSSRSNAHVNAFRKIDFDNLPPSSNQQCTPPVELLCKETATLHKVLSRHVGEADVAMIMTPIFAQYAREWTRAVREVGVRGEEGKAALLRDVEFIASRFAKMEGSADLGANLIGIVREKQVRKSVEVAPPTPSRPGTASGSTASTTTNAAAAAPTEQASSSTATDAKTDTSTAAPKPTETATAIEQAETKAQDAQKADTTIPAATAEESKDTKTKTETDKEAEREGDPAVSAEGKKEIGKDALT